MSPPASNGFTLARKDALGPMVSLRSKHENGNHRKPREGAMGWKREVRRTPTLGKERANLTLGTQTCSHKTLDVTGTLRRGSEGPGLASSNNSSEGCLNTFAVPQIRCGGAISEVQSGKKT